MSPVATSAVLVLLACTVAGCSTGKKETPAMLELQAAIERFAPTVITADTSGLSGGDRGALHRLIDAAAVMDRIYLRQVWSGNEELRRRLEADSTPEGILRLRYFTINMSPWSALDRDTPFVPGVPPKPPGANYYPDGMTKDQFTAWVASLPPQEKAKATGFFTTIRTDPAGGFRPVPYSEEYGDLLTRAAKLLREAAALADNRSLGTFLQKRADAFLSNDYYDSDLAWMDLDSPIDVTIGPYEVYMDELFNYKAAFEAFITLRNEPETARLARFSAYLQEIENHLPIDARYRNPKLGALAPIRVVDEVATGGEARGGVQTAAFNLPNDERVVSEKGSKRVLLRNVQEAKFEKVLVPISRVAVDLAQQSQVAFEPFFTHILMHELMHGLGPHTIRIGGKVTTVREQLKEQYSALEEAKADISGLFALQYLIDRGVIERSMEDQLYVTYLAGVFRTLRFGTGDAHAKGMALQYGYLAEKGAFSYSDSTGTFRVNIDKIKPGVRDLTAEIMTIQAEGSYEKAKDLMNRYSALRPEMQRTFRKLASIPVDIAPTFPLAGEKAKATTD